MPIDGLVLPAHLDERTTLARRGTDGDLVVCWLHHADRVHENPVLEVAAAALAGLWAAVLWALA